LRFLACDAIIGVGFASRGAIAIASFAESPIRPFITFISAIAGIPARTHANSDGRSEIAAFSDVSFPVGSFADEQLCEDYPIEVAPDDP